MTTDTLSTLHRKTFLGHPRGLVVLFFAEMWERFSFYGLRAVLVIYLTWHFLYERDTALTLYGAYVSLVYLAPLLGGYLADKYIGFRKAVIFGGLLLVVGHGLMGVHGQPAREYLDTGEALFEFSRANYDEAENRTLDLGDEIVTITKSDFRQLGKGSLRREVTYTRTNGVRETISGELTRERSPYHESILILALAFIATGVGFLKPCISTCVGALYDENDYRRDAGFTIYYMGINLGAAAASISVPILVLKYGWSVGFGAAAIGMAIGLITFVLFQKELEGRAGPPADIDQKKVLFGPLTAPAFVYLLGLALVIMCYVLLQIPGKMSIGMHALFGFVSLSILIYMLRGLDTIERDRMISVLILILSSIMFWVLFDQAASSLNFFAKDHVVNEIGGWEFPATILQSMNAIFIIMFALPVAGLWTWLGAKGLSPNVFAKFAMALFQIGAGYLVLNWGISTAAADLNGVLRISVVFIILLYLLHTTGELFLSPVGLSAVTKLSVPKLVGFMMGYWFFATSYANIIAAFIAKKTQVPEGSESEVSIAAYNAVYFQMGIAAVGLGVVLLLASGLLSRLTHGADN